MTVEIVFTKKDNTTVQGTHSPIIEDTDAKGTFTFNIPEDMSMYKSVEVIVTNNRDGTPDTGVVLDSLPYVLILVIAAAAVVAVVIKKKRSRDDD